MWPFRKKEQRSIEDPSIPLSDPRAFEMLFRSVSSATGEIVTSEKALRVPAVWAAVNVISSTFASVPLKLYQRTEEGRENVTADPLAAILHDAPNPEWTSYRWRKYTMTRTLLDGRSYTFIERNVAGRVVNLWPLSPNNVVLERSNGRTRYHYYEGEKSNQQTAIYEPHEIIDLPWMLDLDGFRHVDPVAKMRDTIALSLALGDYAADFFRNGGVPPLVLEGPAMSPAAAKRASDDITQALQGRKSDGNNVLTMPAGHSLKPVGVDPEKTQMQEARRFQVEETSRVYGIPPVFLQDLTHGTFSNTEQQDLHFVKHTMAHWFKAAEQELNLKLFGHRNNSQFVEFSLDGLLRGDFKTRMDGYAQGVQNSLITPNEARRMENRPPMDGGDSLFIQQNMSGLNALGNDDEES